MTTLVVSLGIAAMALTGCTPDGPPSVDGENTVTEIEAEFGVGTTTFQDSTLVSPHLTIQITDSKVIQPGEAGNEYGEAPVLAFWYDTTNLSGQEVNPLTAWFTHFRAVQVQGDGSEAITELTLGMSPGEQFTATQSQTIVDGATVRNAVAYTLIDVETPVELVASDAVLNQVGSTMYPLG